MSSNLSTVTITNTNISITKFSNGWFQSDSKIHSKYCWFRTIISLFLFFSFRFSTSFSVISIYQSTGWGEYLIWKERFQTQQFLQNGLSTWWVVRREKLFSISWKSCLLHLSPSITLQIMISTPLVFPTYILSFLFITKIVVCFCCYVIINWAMCALKLLKKENF